MLGVVLDVVEQLVDERGLELLLRRAEAPRRPRHVDDHRHRVGGVGDPDVRIARFRGIVRHAFRGRRRHPVAGDHLHPLEHRFRD